MWGGRDGYGRKTMHTLELNSAMLKCKIHKLLSINTQKQLEVEVGNGGWSMREVILFSPGDEKCCEMPRKCWVRWGGNV